MALQRNALRHRDGYATLHAFASGDGVNPYAAPVELGNKIYGTTEYGGHSGEGVVYAFAKPPQ